MFLKWSKFAATGALLTLSMPALSQVVAPPSTFAPACQSLASDADGDGWGWENNRTCVISDAETSRNTKPICRIGTADPNGDGYGFQAGVSCLIVKAKLSCKNDSSDTNGDGYGFEDGRSCVVDSQTLTIEPPLVSNESTKTPEASYESVVHNGIVRPVCESAESDSDGDGWGFENGKSCVTLALATDQQEIIEQEPEIAAANPRPVHPDCAFTSSDTDNDGFGFENGTSCVVTDNSETPVVEETTSNESEIDNAEQPLAKAPGTINPVDRTSCASSLSDPNGDGFGFEGGNSCIVTAASRPVPICLSIQSDLGGSGYGFERGATCIAVEGVSADRDNLLLAEPLCESWLQIAYGDYRIQNNTWNSGAMYSDNWMQCIELNLEAGQPVASWTFDWLTPQEGDLDQVKSYPQVFYGRKEANEISGSYEDVGLPELVTALPDFKVDYQWSVTGNAEHNVALESFFHTTCEANNTNKEYEMMVWVGIPETKTPGVLMTTATIDGKRWQVYANPTLSWGYVAFVSEEDSFSGTLDWNSFIDWSRKNSRTYGLGELRTGSCMGAIEMGTETFWGKGEFTLHQFNVRTD